MQYVVIDQVNTLFVEKYNYESKQIYTIVLEVTNNSDFHFSSFVMQYNKMLKKEIFN